VLLRRLKEKAQKFSRQYEVKRMETAPWTDPYWAIAADTNMTWLWIILLALGGIGFILARLGVSGKLPNWRQSSPPSGNSSAEHSSIVQKVNKYCPRCGTANALKAGFCTNCGNQFPSQ
jgi:hypothetical protein